MSGPRKSKQRISLAEKRTRHAMMQLAAGLHPGEHLANALHASEGVPPQAFSILHDLIFGLAGAASGAEPARQFYIGLSDTFLLIAELDSTGQVQDIQRRPRSECSVLHYRETRAFDEMILDIGSPIKLQVSVAALMRAKTRNFVRSLSGVAKLSGSKFVQLYRKPVAQEPGGVIRSIIILAGLLAGYMAGFLIFGRPFLNDPWVRSIVGDIVMQATCCIPAAIAFIFALIKIGDRRQCRKAASRRAVLSWYAGISALAGFLGYAPFQLLLLSGAAL